MFGYFWVSVKFGYIGYRLSVNSVTELIRLLGYLVKFGSDRLSVISVNLLKIEEIKAYKKMKKPHNRSLVQTSRPNTYPFPINKNSSKYILNPSLFATTTQSE